MSEGSNSTNNISNATGASTSSFLAALVLNSAIFGAEIAAFTILRPQFRLIYEPRALLPLESKRLDPLPGRFIEWPYALYKADYTKVKRLNGNDAYWFLRFLRMMVRTFIPIWFLSWAVLMPIASVNTQVAGHTGLDRFTYGNIENTKQTRFAAHLILAYLFAFWVWYNIRYEMRHFVQSRQHLLTDPVHSATAQSRTLLITGIPARYLTERQLFNLFSYLPGGVEQVWLNRDLKDLPDVYNAREDACKKLESAETELLGTATKNHFKKIAAEEEANRKTNKKTDKTREEHAMQEVKGTRPLTAASVHSNTDIERDIALAEKLVPREQRPTHRLPLWAWLPFSIPFTGKKVDSIDWAREEIARCNEVLEQGRLQWRKDVASDDDNADDMYKPLNSAFVLFKQQIAAHLALQSLTHHGPYRMSGKHIEIAERDVIWDNLGLNPYEQRVRRAISLGITAGLVILWSFPVAFVGAVSNVPSLCNTYKWLAWICKLPEAITGAISGFLPPVSLAILMLLLPIVLRLLAQFEGIPSRTGVELALMHRFFSFQVIHSFLIVTLSSGIIAALPDLVKDPTNIPNLLAQRLPLASNFFLTYIILQGLSGTASGFLQAVQLILYYVKIVVMGSTPRSVYDIKFGPRTVNWGTLFPTTTLLVVIALAYCIISPVISGLACSTFFLFYLLYKYLFLWIMQMDPAEDTGGLFFPKAINHIFVGLYIQQICLCALFFLARDENGKASAIPEGALMVVLIFFTAAFQLIIRDSYGPLITALPLTLADKTYGLRKDDPDVVGASGVSSPKKAQTPGEPAVNTEKAILADAIVAKANAEEDRSSAPPTPTTADAQSTGVARPTDQLKARYKSSNDSITQHIPGAHKDDIGEEDTASSVLEEPPEEPIPGEVPTDFTHPAVSKPQRMIWLPVDPLGLAREEEAAIRGMKIDVSTAGASMNRKGHVSISAAPPDFETWAL